MLQATEETILIRTTYEGKENRGLISLYVIERLLLEGTLQSTQFHLHAMSMAATHHSRLLRAPSNAVSSISRKGNFSKHFP